MSIYDSEVRNKSIDLLVTKDKEKPEEITSGPNELYSDINEKVENAKGDTSTWATNKAKFNRIRMRIKKAKTYPFIGASNLRMPTAEIKIKKLKSAVVNVIFGIRPVVQCIPGPSGNYDTAMKIEKFMDHLIMDKMDMKTKGIITVDQTLEGGMYLAKPYWRIEVNTRTEKWELDDLDLQEAMFLFDGNTGLDDVVKYLVDKFSVDMNDHVIEENMIALEEAAVKILSAKEEVEFIVSDMIKNQPDVALISPEKIYIPSVTKVDTQTAPWVCHEYEMDYDEVVRCAEYKGWDVEGVSGLKEYFGVDNRDLRNSQLDLQEGIDRLNSPNNQVLIWEWYGWADLDGDGKKEKVCITIAPEFKKIMRKIGLPFDNGKWPFVKFFYELTTDRWFAHRGIVEIAEDLIKEVDIQHNMKIDYQSANISPMKLYRAGMVNPNLITGAPNQAIPVRGSQPLADTLAVVNQHNPNVEFSYEREEQILLSRVEELIGQIDYTLQSQINRRQPRTLGEVEMQQQSANTVFTLDADQFRMSFGELFGMIWDLWCQYGNDQEEFQYFGENGWEKIRLSKEEIQGGYKFLVRGNDQNTNPNVKIQKAQQIITAITNPVLLQTGVVGPQQIVAGMKRFFQTLDIEGWEQFINTQVQPPQPPPIADLIKPKFKDLTDVEQAQVLQSAGVMPDAQGRMMDKQIEMQQHAVDIMSQMGAK
jgi:hypothetical protein